MNEGRVCLPTAFLVDGDAGVLAVDDDPDTGDFFWTGVRGGESFHLLS